MTNSLGTPARYGQPSGPVRGRRGESRNGDLQGAVAMPQLTHVRHELILAKQIHKVSTDLKSRWFNNCQEETKTQCSYN